MLYYHEISQLNNCLFTDYIVKWFSSQSTSTPVQRFPGFSALFTKNDNTLYSHWHIKLDCMFTNQGSVGSGLQTHRQPLYQHRLWSYIHIFTIILFHHAPLANTPRTSTGATFIKMFLDLYWESVAAAEKVGQKDTNWGWCLKEMIGWLIPHSFNW